MKPLPDLAAVVLWMAGAFVVLGHRHRRARTGAGTRPVRHPGGPGGGRGGDRRGGRAPAPPAAGGAALRLHLARNLVHWGGNYAWSYGVTLLPLAVVFALEFTTPAWVTLLAVLILRERLTASRVAAVALGFLGVLVVLRPGVAALQPASLVVLAAAVMFALTAVATKALTRTESVLSILFWMNLIQLPLNLVAGRIFPAVPAHAFEGHHALALAILCIAGLTSHWCLTSAYRRGDAILVMPLDFLRIPLIAVLGWRFYGEPLDPWLFVGAGLIVGGIVWNLAAEARRQAPAVQAEGA